MKASHLLSLLGVAIAMNPVASYADPFGNIVNTIGNTITTALGKAASILLGMGLGQINAAINAFFANLFGTAPCSNNGTISDVLCNVLHSSNNLPGFITAISYLMGVVMAVMAIVKLKDHVLNPNQTPLSDSMKRFVAGGALFTLPLITEASQNLLTNGDTTMSEVSQYGYAGSTNGGYGLDTMLVALFSDIYEPLMNLIFAFGYLAGLVLTVVAITRLLKTAQDGPRGPASLGTIMCIIVAGVLFSLSTIMASFSTSMFGDSTISTFAMLQTSTGDAVIDDHILSIISTVLVFMTIIGFISFLRGFFMLKEVAEGNGQASLMAAVTHIFGGALAVNLGSLMNAVQTTLGLDGLGVMFY